MNIIGLDIGGTKCAVSVPDGTERVREVVRFTTTDVRGTLDRLFAEVAKLKPEKDTVFGVSCGGPLDSTKGLILSPPNLPWVGTGSRSARCWWRNLADALS